MHVIAKGSLERKIMYEMFNARMQQWYTGHIINTHSYNNLLKSLKNVQEG